MVYVSDNGDINKLGHKVIDLILIHPNLTKQIKQEHMNLMLKTSVIQADNNMVEFLTKKNQLQLISDISYQNFSIFHDAIAFNNIEAFKHLIFNSTASFVQIDGAIKNIIKYTDKQSFILNYIQSLIESREMQPLILSGKINKTKRRI